MGERKLNKSARFERMYKIWEYLKRNTDREHPATQAAMRKDPDLSELMGDKETFNRLIKDMARVMNSDEYGYKPEEEWKIYFHDFKQFYEELDEKIDENIDDDKEYENYLKRSMRLKGLHYNHTFSYEEINNLIEGVLASKTIDTNTAKRLIEKIEDNLTTKFYKKGSKRICKVMEPMLADGELLRENLLLIQEAIDHNAQISFRFNGYSYRKRLEPVSEEKYTLSPYYIVASSGRYYLLACMPVRRNGKQLKNMSIWRIDLMTDIEIPGRNEKLGLYGSPRVPKREVENLPMEWSEDFQLKHLHMSFDKPEWITLRIKSEKRKDNSAKRVRADYTFLHDWFGDSFRYMYCEEEPPYDDIVKVECSPYGMVHWALQYSDRVEVLEPEHVREAVIEKVRNLNEKYRLK